MKEILSKQLKRQLDLLEILLTKEWFTTEEISKSLDSSERTIRSDIQEINTYIQPLSIDTSIKLGVSLQIPDGYSRGYLYMKILEYSIEFSLLEKIYFNNYANIEDLAEEIFVSVTTLKRLIKRVNIILQKQDFRINSRMQLVGDELKICNFMIQLFLEKYELVERKFSITEIQLIDEIATNFQNENPTIFKYDLTDFGQLNRMRMMFLIVLHRFVTGNRLPIELLNKHSFNADFLLDENFQQEFLKCFQIQINRDIINHLFYLYFSPQYVVNGKQLREKSMNNPTIGQVYQSLCQSVQQISDYFDVQYDDIDELVYQVHYSCLNIYGIQYILYEKNNDFFSGMKHEYQLFVQYLTASLKTAFQPYQFSEAVLPNIVYQAAFRLLTNWPELASRIENSLVQINAYLIGDSSQAHQLFLKESIENYYNHRYKITICSEQNLVGIQEKVIGYDCVITTASYLDIPDIPVISLSMALTVNDVYKLYDFYNNKLMKKHSVWHKLID